MSHKLCPFGFYSFYVNKQVAQAGGCHHCVEERCALWDTYYDEYGNTVGQCALMSITESLRSIADSSESSGRMLPIAGTSTGTGRAKATSAIGGVLEKLKAKKAAKEAKKDDASSSETADETNNNETDKVSTKNEQNQSVPSTATKSKPASTAKKETAAPPAPPPPPVPSSKAEQTPKKDSSEENNDLESLLKPPSVPISELPVISVSDSKSKEETSTPSNTTNVEVTVKSEAQNG